MNARLVHRIKFSFRSKIIWFVAGCFFLHTPPIAHASGELFYISTTAEVSDKGQVEITLRLKNNWRKTLFDVQPVFHFHHTMYKMPPIMKLEPGETVTRVTSKHPPVLRVGRYPVMAAVNYTKSVGNKNVLSQTHADSFFFKEPVESVIEVEISSEERADASLLKILLKNNSPSLKNIRAMLLLPPGLMSGGFKGMVGLTIRPGEKKYFEVPIEKHVGKPSGDYPVHLMVEYAEMLKHYAGVIPGNVKFSPTWAESEKWPQALVFVFLLATVIMFFRRSSLPAQKA